MAMPRSAGSTSFITLPPMAMSPPLMSSSPAIILKSVDLPQPEGPTKTTNSPSATSMFAPCTTSKLPKRFMTLVRVTAAIALLPT